MTRVGSGGQFTSNRLSNDHNQCILLRAVVTGGSERAKGGKSQTEWLEASLFGELGVAKKKMKITNANIVYNSR